jgi:hypothetical protein
MAHKACAPSGEPWSFYRLRREKRVRRMRKEEKCSKICRFERNNVTLPPKTKDSYLMNVRFDKTKA